MMAKNVKVKDRGWRRINKAFKSLDGWEATIGAHGDAGKHKGGIDNVALTAIHEFGVQFRHPGGTPYTFVGNRVVFLKKGDPRAIGITRPHMIQIPERSFLRSTWDKRVKSYERLLQKQAGLVMDGRATAPQAVGIVGEKVLADVKRTIKRGVPPPLKPATVARKGSTKQLIDTGQMIGSLHVKVKKA